MMNILFLVLLAVLSAAPALASINVISGNLSQRQTLFNAQGGPMPLAVTLSYTSYGQVAGALGEGWSHSYEVYLHENSNGTLVFTGGRGKRFYFPDGSGNYTPRSGDFSSLTYNDNGTPSDPVDDSWNVTLRNGMVYKFGADKKLTSIVDRYGNTVSVTHATDGLSTIITDPATRSITITYDAPDGKVQTIVDPASNVYNFSYNPTSELLEKVESPEPSEGKGRPAWQYFYNTDGLLEYKVDPKQNISKYGYDTQGRCNRSVDPGGVTDTNGGETADVAQHTKSFQYGVPGVGQTTLIEKDGGQWIYSYDVGQGVITGKTDPDQNTVTTTYYPTGHVYEGMVETVVKPVEGITTYVTTNVAYDNYGNVLEMTGNAKVRNKSQAIDRHMKYTYDNGNYDRLTSVTNMLDASPTPTTISYDVDPLDSLERMTATDTDGHQTVVRYNANGTVHDVKKGGLPATVYAYAADGLLQSVLDPSGVRTELLVYNALGQPQTVNTIATDGSTRTTTLAYDALGRNETITRLGSVVNYDTLFDYDNNGNRTSVTDAEQRTTDFNYNYKGQTTRITQSLSGQPLETWLDYSSAGCPSCGGGVDKLVGVTDAKNQETRFEYDNTGKLVREVPQVSHAIRYEYYESGLLWKKIDDVTGATILEFVYEPNGKIITQTDHVFGEVTSYTYYPNGLLWTAGNLHITYTFDYYPNGWLKSVTDSNGRIISYDQHDEIGQRKQVTLLKGLLDERVLNYEYDAEGRLWKIKSSAGTFEFGYDSFSRRKTLTYPNQVVATYGYHPDMDWLTSLDYNTSSGTVTSIGYPEHDKVGNRKQKTEDGVTTTYGYDDIYRLTSATTPETTEAFAYDVVGNRESGPTVKDIADVAYDHNTADQMLKGRKFEYTYDDFGNQQHRYMNADHSKFWKYTWDGQNRLRKAELNLGTQVLRTVNFKYGPFGRRIEKQVVDPVTTVTTTFVYDGEDIVFTFANDGIKNTETHFVHGSGIDEPLAMVRDGQASYYHADGLGSILAMTDASGNIVQGYSYEAFGQLTASDPTFDNFYTYTGREYDKETGLYYYRARYYDAMEGRFISKDPIAIAGGDMNLYGYVQNDPINYLDMWGLWRYYGNWGGPDWTGGYDKSWDQMTPTERNAALTDPTRVPIDSQDSCYMSHDICYGNTRENAIVPSCPSEYLKNGFNKCDTELSNCLLKSGITPRLTGEIRRLLAIPTFQIQPAYRNRGFSDDGRSYYQFKFNY